MPPSKATNTVTLTNFNKELPAALLKAAAAKCSVRECDETEKNEFVAYVDEGDKSFDVSMGFDAGKQLSWHLCDCEKRATICKHKVAVLLYLANGKSTTPKKQTKKVAPISKSQQLLDGLDRTELAAWVAALLQKNKDIELAFLHHFDTQSSLTPDQVRQLTNDAVSSVIKRKTKADASEVKKIVDLWAQVHEPVLLAYKNNPANLDAFDNLHTMIETCLECWSRIISTSNRIDTYIEKTLESTVTAIAGLQQTDDWQTALSFYCVRIENNHTYEQTKRYYLRQLDKIMALAGIERKSIAVEMLMETYRDLQKKRYDVRDLTKMLFKLVVEAGAIDRYLTDFKPMHWELSYNIALIRQYMERGLLTDAEKFCHDQIRANAREEYNEPYLMILRAIYTAQDSTTKLVKVAEALIPLQWKLDDFKLAATLIGNDKELSTWRTKTFAKARTCSLHGDYAATEFTFALLDHEQNYRRMIEIIDAAASWPIILAYFDKMHAKDDALLLTKLLNKEEFNPRILRKDAPDDLHAIPGLLKKLLSQYDGDALTHETTNALRRARSKYPNELLLHLANALGIR